MAFAAKLNGMTVQEFTEQVVRVIYVQIEELLALGDVLCAGQVLVLVLPGGDQVQVFPRPRESRVEVSLWLQEESVPPASHDDLDVGKGSSALVTIRPDSIPVINLAVS